MRSMQRSRESSMASSRGSHDMAVRSQHLDMLSICTGGGGLDLGVGLALPSARSVCLVEREAFAVAHLVAAMRAGLLDDAPIWSDARTFDGRAWRGCVDGLIGGIPCQPHSLAGKRLAEEDERDLWSTARRIIVQARPWFVLIENVGGMLSSGGAERVWRDLRRLGYAVEIGLFAAAEVGASHERERLFILGVADGLYQQWWGGHGAAGYGPSELFVGHGDQHVANAGLWSAERRGGAGDMARSGGEPEGEARQRKRRGHALGGCGEAMADASGKRGAAGISGPQRSDQGGHAGKPDDYRDALVDAASIGRGEGRAEPSIRGGRAATAFTSGDVDDASIARGRAIPIQPGRQDEAGGHTDGTGAWPLFPPGPSDSSNWQAALARAPELEPAFRRVADGLASRLDLARVDRLRLLGNGVVPLQAGYALRTLATRLARRSAGAGELVRLMGAQP